MQTPQLIKLLMEAHRYPAWVNLSISMVIIHNQIQV
jgi:hypothetical protein